MCCGLLTSVCVHHTAAGAHQRAFRVSIVSDACADLTTERHDSVLKLYGNKYMYDVINLETAISVLRSSDTE